MSETQFEIPSWKEKEEAIRHIDCLDLKTVTIEQLMEFLKVIFKGIVTVVFKFPAGISLFRAIKYKTKPLLNEDIVYPPIDKALMNRASDFGEQMFYCSTVKKVPFFELEIKIGNRLVIANWTNTIPLLLNNVGYHLQELEELARNYNVEFNYDKNESNLLSENSIKTLKFIKNTFSKKIENPEYNKLTIAIAKKLYDSKIIDRNETEEWAGLLYHTIRLNGIADNIVLKKELLDFGLIKMQQIEYIEIVAIENDKYTYNILDFADTIEDGKIKWHNLTDTWTVTDESDDFYFAETQSGYALYTSEGNILDPNSLKV